MLNINPKQTVILLVVLNALLGVIAYLLKQYIPPAGILLGTLIYSVILFVTLKSAKNRLIDSHSTVKTYYPKFYILIILGVIAYYLGVPKPYINGLFAALLGIIILHITYFPLQAYLHAKMQSR